MAEDRTRGASEMTAWEKATFAQPCKTWVCENDGRQYSGQENAGGHVRDSTYPDCWEGFMKALSRPRRWSSLLRILA